jgi:hypothetical protein
MSFAQNIKEELPKAWKYFADFLTDNYPELTNFEELKFELQLGVYIQFFETNNSDIQLYSTNSEALQDAVKEAFETYNEYLFLDS